MSENWLAFVLMYVPQIAWTLVDLYYAGELHPYPHPCYTSG